METLKNLTKAYDRFKAIIKIYFMTLGLIATLFSIGNQEVIAQLKPKSIRVSLYNEATSLPSGWLFSYPIHPGIAVGTDLMSKSGKHWQKSFGVDLTFYHHKISENAIMLDATYSIGYKLGFGLQIKWITAAGYKRSFLPGDVYKFEDGEYRRITDWGMSHFNFKLGFGLEFPLNGRFSLTTDRKMMIAFPYSKSLPFSAHAFTGFGVKVNLAYDR